MTGEPGPHWQPLTGDASGRRYYRGTDGILVVYPESMVSGMDHFLFWRDRYAGAGIPVPQILQVDRGQRTMLLEDLGDCHGTDFLEMLNPEVAVEFVRDIHDWIGRIVRMADGTAEHRLPPVPVETELAFLMRHGPGVVFTGEDMGWLRQLCDTVITRLKDVTWQLAHRDFHLRNVLVRDGKPVLIDFQDTRLAPVHYDRVSLLFDNYANLQGIRESVWPVLDDPVLRWVGLQRALKALGTFCYFGFKGGKPWFRRSVLPAVRHVADHLAVLGLNREQAAWQAVMERASVLTPADG